MGDSPAFLIHLVCLTDAILLLPQHTANAVSAGWSGTKTAAASADESLKERTPLCAFSFDSS